MWNQAKMIGSVEALKLESWKAVKLGKWEGGMKEQRAKRKNEGVD